MELRHVLLAVFRFAAATYNEIRKYYFELIKWFKRKEEMKNKKINKRK